MTSFCYAPGSQLADLIHLSGLPESTPPANAFRILAHSPAVGAAALRLVFSLLTETNLDPVLRELTILRVAQRCDCRYAWAQHVEIGRAVGLSEEQLMALERGETPVALFNERDSSALALANEVLDTSRAKGATIAIVRSRFSPREIVELLMLIGYFRLICGVMTTLGIEEEPPFGLKILDSLRDSARG